MQLIDTPGLTPNRVGVFDHPIYYKTLAFRVLCFRQDCCKGRAEKMLAGGNGEGADQGAGWGFPGEREESFRNCNSI